MTDLYQTEIVLEEEARGLTIQRFHKDHLKGTLEETFSETFLGSHLIGNYLLPYTQGISEWLKASNSGKAGRRSRAAVLIEHVDPALLAFLMLKAILNKVGVYHEGKPCSFTGLTIYGGGLIHDELRLREFDAEHTKLSRRIHADFNSRELTREKREEYMQKTFAKHDMEWSIWSKTEMVQVGTALLDVFRAVTGDIEVITEGSGKAKRDIIQPSLGLLQAVEMTSDHCEAMFTTYFPTVIPPKPWSSETLETGGYHSHHVTPYPLVKASKKAYRSILKGRVADGSVDRVLRSINGLQETKWAVNVRALDAIEAIYARNIPCGKLPRADRKVPDPAPMSLEGLDVDHPDVKAYRVYCFGIHENNRRIIGKRVMAQRAFHLARKFSQFDAIYFPHDLDSRGRAYPKPSGLNPQGPDYVKGILHFAEGKTLGQLGLYWLGVHGANCFGQDKLPLDERSQWARDNTQLAQSVARNPLQDLSWTRCDNPVQFLAWCFEWAEAHSLKDPSTYRSRLHVDLDATCSGLQHFSAMLRDKVGGYHVNMVPNDVRQDVYGAVAKVALELIQNDPDEEKVALAKAWLDFGMTRSTTKRSVMVKPYAGTRMSCTGYVSEAVEDALKEGVALPVPRDMMWEFKMYGADKVWKAIPKVVVAADGAMQWLMTVSRLVGRSQPRERRIEWNTPLGLPVHQYKFDTRSRRIETFFDGARVQPRITEDLDTLDPRQMATSVAPSFVHSLDACHLQATISAAMDAGLEHFAAVHDSFGVHACDVEQFTRIIREAFVQMYEEHDVLAEFLETAMPLIAADLREEIPALPARGSLDLRGILENQFFFS
ncbi:DNA-directed RNA polymerase [Pararhizobium sp.]|uniref:DNA-directed RNA polymerase n=1 Tax=Pararhizobium sp. TaxID=1977563 RepID=UPI003BACDAA8